MRSIVIIGSGNVAASLGHAFLIKGAIIEAVHSLHVDHARSLASQLGATAIEKISDIPSKADLYILAVKDDAIALVSDHLKVSGLVVHCSGGTPLSVLSAHPQHGVLYPIQSVTKDSRPDFEHVPICVEGNNPQTLEQIKQFAALLSMKVVALDSQQRQALHVAAVFANNFTNYLFTIAAGILKEHKIPFNLLHPLILETALRVQKQEPALLQTGPAIRHDHATMQRHLALLEKLDGYADIYKLLSEAIGTQNKPND